MTNPIIAGVELNPGHETALHFSKKQFQSLELWSHALEIERLLGDPSTLFEHRSQLVTFKRFLVLAERTNKGMHLLFTGAPEGRHVAVFTADDAAQRFKNEVTADGQRTVEIRAYDGFSLFHELENLAVDGLVFNPSGPTEPVPKDSAFISFMVGIPGMRRDEILKARTVAEAHLYMDMLGCPPGRRNHQLVDIGGHLVSQYTTPVTGQTEPQTFRFLVASKDLSSDDIGDNTPSHILDPAAFLRYADVLARSVPGSPDGLDTKAIKAGRYHLERAAQCIDEVLKFLPATSDELHEDAFLTPESNKFWSIAPRRFNRLRLQAVATTYRNIAAQFLAAEDVS